MSRLYYLHFALKRCSIVSYFGAQSEFTNVHQSGHQRLFHAGVLNVRRIVSRFRRSIYVSCSFAASKNFQGKSLQRAKPFFFFTCLIILSQYIMSLRKMFTEVSYSFRRKRILWDLKQILQYNGALTIATSKGKDQNYTLPCNRSPAGLSLIFNSCHVCMFWFLRMNNIRDNPQASKAESFFRNR